MLKHASLFKQALCFDERLEGRSPTHPTVPTRDIVLAKYSVRCGPTLKDIRPGAGQPKSAQSCADRGLPYPVVHDGVMVRRRAETAQLDRVERAIQLGGGPEHIVAATLVAAATATSTNVSYGMPKESMPSRGSSHVLQASRTCGPTALVRLPYPRALATGTNARP